MCSITSNTDSSKVFFFFPKILLCSALALLLGACATSSIPQQKALLGSEIAAIHEMDWEDARHHFVDKTYRRQDFISGTFISYFGEQGRIYTWSSGETEIYVGLWKLEKQTSIWNKNGFYELCKAYPRKTTNPFTGSLVDYWDCKQISHFADFYEESIQGDTFSLSTRKLPFELDRSNDTLSILKEKLKQ